VSTTGCGCGRSPTSGSATQLFNDARKLTRDIAARVEVARGQTLATGTTPIPELGITISWGRAGAHSVTAATLWTNTAADILNDLMSWRDTYLATNGVDPGSMSGPGASGT
jgi:hypothetical protein